MTVKSIAQELDLWVQIEAAVRRRLSIEGGEDFLSRISAIPVRKSHATRSLGAYVSNLAGPACIRLQFAQEAAHLKQTFLHEVAHACDHLSRNAGQYRRAHGPEWRQWALSLGIEPERCGTSEALAELHRQRLKLVATCQRCGTEFRRVRRLNRRRRYVHTECGGRLRPVP